MATLSTPYKAIADPTRRQILDLLREGSLPAGTIARRFPRLSRPAISKHLTVLRRSRLVAVRKRGRERLYVLNPRPLRQVAAWIYRYEKFWGRQLRSLKEYVESQNEEERRVQS